MAHRSLKFLIVATATMATLQSALAAVAQEPLLNRPNAVSPNLVLVLDTSGSMDNEYIYQYGETRGGDGMSGPNTTTYAQYSPDVNRIYYDPRTRYLPRVDYQGNALAADAPTSKKWEVYFRIGTGVYTFTTLGTLAEYYNPSYTPAASIVVAGNVGTYPNSVAKSTPTQKFPKFIKRSDCVAQATYCTDTEERQNYSNWNKWYSTRGLMAVTGLGAAFQPLKTDSIRLGYGTIGQLDGENLQQGVSSYTDTSGGVKDKFFTWMYAQRFNTGTPNLTAINNVGKYYSRTDNAGPWATTPSASSKGVNTVSGTSAAVSATHASCRRSFAMLVTDGYSNGTVPTTAGNADNLGFSISPAVGKAFDYKPSSPYKDAYSNTMADLAMYYWGRDLRSDLANRVPVISTNRTNNPSTWQNMSFYAVTLGIDGKLTHDAATIDKLNRGAQDWPEPKNNTPTTIDDLWHATINARGELLNANNASELTTGLTQMFEAIAGDPQTLSGVAVSTTFLKNGTRKYKPEYIPSTWSGKLSAIQLDGTTGNDAVPSKIYWQVENGVDVNGNPISTIPSALTRNIFTWNGTAAVPFNATNSGLSADIVNYLRGDASKELRNSGGIYRNRTAILGDIVNSSPAYIFDNVNLSYEKLGANNGYPDFVAGKKARGEGVLFVGANDGMLHAFRDSNGAEVFAFVPQAVIPKLTSLTQTPYTHQYYVDGPNVETDAYLDSAWTNVLLGTTGAGAKAVYAMDVTTPLSMSASKVLWEVNSATAGFANLGYVMSDVQAGKVAAAPVLPNDDWVAIFGNGFDSATGKASLFVVNLKTGALIKEIVADAGPGNGLGGVRILRDSTQQIVGAYAGDLKGNMWKFDLTGNDKSNWRVGLSGSPLYAAGSTQPITAAPAIIPHPTTGYVVAFGTGKFLDTGDTTGPYDTQRMYGIWDAQAFGSAAVTTPPGASVTGVSQLQVQTIGTQTVGATTYYTQTKNTVDWGDGLLTKKRGWYQDLPNSGQRVVYPIERLSGTAVIASTLSAESSAATDLCVQSGSGSGWVYIFDGLTGAGPSLPIFDTNGDGYVDSTDAAVSGYQDPVDGRPVVITIKSSDGNGGGTGEQLCIENAQATCVKVTLKCGGGGGMGGCKPCVPGTAGCTPGGPLGGTLSIKTREWRQIFMR